ncbi:hypothetical protein ABIC22_004438 [Paenibacillus sp. PvP094]|uniref:hypothetical protein n=1 Tax=Paenibacillus sp. PvP094 TaxID=3156394 RepID=UPI003395C355
MFKQVVSLIFIWTVSVGIIVEPLIAAANSKGVSLDIDMQELQRAADFKLLVPYNLDRRVKVEIKNPYVPGQPVSEIRLHFFDDTGQTYLFSVEEHKAVGYKSERQVTYVDLQNRTSVTRTFVEDFKFSERGEKININGTEGRFERWANRTPGGYLRWIQDDTYIEIDSKVFTKEEMMDWASHFSMMKNDSTP